MKRLGIILMLTFVLLIRPAPALGEEGPAKWRGTDEVIEEVLQKYGARAREPFINTDQGDLILFVFTLGGLGAGFIMGYHGRRIFVEMEGLEPENPGRRPCNYSDPGNTARPGGSGEGV